MKFGPTSANSLPARIVWCVSDEAKAKLVECVSDGNKDKVKAAPVSALVGYDIDFHEELPWLFPHTDAKSWFEGDEESAATLLLPFMALSGLFEDEPDMADLSRDAIQAERLVQQLPELTLDLYLHYRVPPESPKPTPRKKKPAGRSGKQRR